jgi:hypothetical protein
VKGREKDRAGADLNVYVIDERTEVSIKEILCVCVCVFRLFALCKPIACVKAQKKGRVCKVEVRRRHVFKARLPESNRLLVSKLPESIEKVKAGGIIPMKYEAFLFE